MKREDIINTCVEHKHALIFAAGIATAIIGKKIIESKTVKDAATKGMATVMSAKRDAEEENTNDTPEESKRPSFFKKKEPKNDEDTTVIGTLEI